MPSASELFGADSPDINFSNAGIADSDHAAVRDLFIAINRTLAPVDMKEAFERYLETALAAEIDRLVSFYSRERGNGFLAAVRDLIRECGSGGGSTWRLVVVRVCPALDGRICRRVRW